MTHHRRTPSSALILAFACLVLAAGQAASQPTSGQQFDDSQVESGALGTWSGQWSSDIYSGKGQILINVEKAGNGRVSGTGTSSGGPCDRNFTMTGAYQGSLVQLELTFPEAGQGCEAGQVRMSLRMGRQGNQSVAVGHWAVTEGGPGAGKYYGIITLTK
jgi:hypothetical protein